MKYFIVEGFELLSLIEEVNRMIEQGWIPSGGVTCTSVVGRVYWFQAMVKQKEKGKPKKVSGAQGDADDSV